MTLNDGIRKSPESRESRTFSSTTLPDYDGQVSSRAVAFSEDCLLRLGEEYSMLKLSQKLDSEISKIVENFDFRLDTSEFDCIEYFQLLFPDGSNNLEKIELALNNVDNQLRGLDDQCYNLVLNQPELNTEAQKLMETIRAEAKSVVEKVKEIKTKAKSCEEFLREMTNDIKTLDFTKKNLAITLNLLKRIYLINGALDQLKVFAGKKQHEETVEILQFTLKIIDPLRKYTNLPSISTLTTNCKNAQLEIKRNLISDFVGAFSNGNFVHLANQLCASCLVLQAMEFDAKSELIYWYCEEQLKDYYSMFRHNPEMAGLSEISRRFSWLKRLLKYFDDMHSNLFPKEWMMDEKLTERFCLETKNDISAFLSKTEKENNFDTKTMLAALEITLEFEGKLGLRFRAESVDELNGESTVMEPKMKRIISSAFDMYLWHYVDMEDKNLAERFESFQTDLTESEDEIILMSSVNLFLFYRQTLTNCSKLSTRKPFLDLIKMYQKWLNAYAGILTSKFPKDERKPTQEEIRITCVVVNTAEYCFTTIGQLEEKVIEMIDKEFKSVVSFQAEVDAFMSISATGIQTLVRVVENTAEPPFLAMTRKNWATLASVGDQSEHISQIAQILKPSAIVIRQVFSGGKFHKLFCDKFAESFLNKFLANIYKCKPLSEIGAEQMLLDLHSLKNILVDSTMLGATEKVQPSATYMKILTKAVSKIEQLLKVAMRPHDPPKGIVDTYNLLFSDHDVNCMIRILELKGLKHKHEIAPVLDYFQTTIPKDFIPNPQNATSGTPAAPPNAPTQTIQTPPVNKIRLTFCKRF